VSGFSRTSIARARYQPAVTDILLAATTLPHIGHVDCRYAEHRRRPACITGSREPAPAGRPLQIAGALLLLLPMTVIAGVAILSTTMVGAMLAWIFFLDSPGAAAFPAIILAILLSVGMAARRLP
jgi:hypothetical protein